MDTGQRKEGPQDIEQEHVAPSNPEATARIYAFMASDAFAPFVLDCLAKAARNAVAEQAKLAPGKRRSE